jgi:hypothetical protein
MMVNEYLPFDFCKWAFNYDEEEYNTRMLNTDTVDRWNLLHDDKLRVEYSDTMRESLIAMKALYAEAKDKS